MMLVIVSINCVLGKDVNSNDLSIVFKVLVNVNLRINDLLGILFLNVIVC